MVCVHIILSSENGIQIRVAVNRQILLTKGQPAQSLLMNKTFQQQNKPISIYVENICGNGLVMLLERFVYIPILVCSNSSFSIAAGKLVLWILRRAGCGLRARARGRGGLLVCAFAIFVLSRCAAEGTNVGYKY